MSTSAFTQAKHGLYSALALAERMVRPPLETTPSALHSLRNFLLLQYPSALGTALHGTPVVAALRKAVPQARIVVAADGFGMEVFRNNPGIDFVLETPNPNRDLLGALRVLRGRSLFEGEPYATLTTAGNERTGIATLALLAGPSLRIGFTVAPQLYFHPLRKDASHSLIENNLRTVQALGHTAPPTEPQIFASAADETRAEALLAESGLLDGSPLAVFVTQSSPTQRKGWRAERFAAVARHVHERYNAHILFVGTAQESDAIDAIRSQLGFASTSLAGRTEICVLAAILRHARIGITLDTGILHIGRAVGLPMVIIAPAWSPPVEWLPLGNPRYRILKNADMPRATADYIIDEVSVEEVSAAADQLMELSIQTGF
ncbi:MAG TPA: glycosyltransferase family 9 protein [Acidobacteriaceae bacterium]|nr:glycosyltransferase family 9 protein [Acidobacteriaceae bacterium]